MFFWHPLQHGPFCRNLETRSASCLFRYAPQSPHESSRNRLTTLPAPVSLVISVSFSLPPCRSVEVKAHASIASGCWLYYFPDRILRVSISDHNRDQQMEELLGKSASTIQHLSDEA